MLHYMPRSRGVGCAVKLQTGISRWSPRRDTPDCAQAKT
jgi:hypothetical protein